MSSVFNNVLNKIDVYSNDSFHTIQSRSIIWGFVPDFILCRTMNLSRYFDLDTFMPQQIFLHFNKKENLGVSLYLMDKNKYFKRPLKVAMLDYSGPVITVDDLSSPRYEIIILSITQFIDSESNRDSRCVNYPYGIFHSYAQCDANYVYKQFSTKYKPLMPFWATEELDRVTSLRSGEAFKRKTLEHGLKQCCTELFELFKYSNRRDI